MDAGQQDARFAELQRRFAELEQRLAAVEADNRRLRAENACLRGENHRLKSEVRRLTERLAQYERLAEATRAGDVGATILINTAAGLARGFKAALPGFGGPDSDQIRALMETRRPQLVALMKKQQIMFFAMSYATVADDEIERYVAFAESPVGRRYQAATVIAVDKAMTDAAVETGRLLVAQKAA